MKPYIAVVDIRTMNLLYLGKSEAVAAMILRPGTCFAKHENDMKTMSLAFQAATEFLTLYRRIAKDGMEKYKLESVDRSGGSRPAEPLEPEAIQAEASADADSRPTWNP